MPEIGFQGLRLKGVDPPLESEREPKRVIDEEVKRLPEDAPPLLFADYRSGELYMRLNASLASGKVSHDMIGG